MATTSWKLLQRIIFTCLVTVIAASLVISSPAHVRFSNNGNPSDRQGKTMNMTMLGMGMMKDILQNGIPFRPLPAPFPSLKNLFKVNGTHLTWVPLGSIIFNHNGKILGG